MLLWGIYAGYLWLSNEEVAGVKKSVRHWMSLSKIYKNHHHRPSSIANSTHHQRTNRIHETSKRHQYRKKRHTLLIVNNTRAPPSVNRFYLERILKMRCDSVPVLCNHRDDRMYFICGVTDDQCECDQIVVTLHAVQSLLRCMVSV